MLDKISLEAANYSYFDGPLNTQDLHCKGLYQKFFDDPRCVVEITLWDFSYDPQYTGPLQPNLKVTLDGSLQEQLSVVGIPDDWDLAKLEAYIFRFVSFIYADAKEYAYAREDGLKAMIQDRISSFAKGKSDESRKT